MSNATNMQLILHFSNGPLVGQAIPITKTETRIGSDPHMNDLVLNDPSLMPEHSRIVIDNNRYIIQSRDANSLLTVNFQQVEYALLQDSDQVKLGNPGVSFVAVFAPMASLTPSVQPATPAQFVAPAQFAPILPAPDIQAPAPSLSPLPVQFPIAEEPQRLPAQADPQFAFSQTPYVQPQTPYIQQQAPAQIVYPQTPLQIAYTETTRYLCAAAHLDEHFQRFVLGKIVGEEHRALGEAYGVDIIPVLKVAYAARKRSFIRDSFLCIILILGLVFLVYSIASLFGAAHAITSATASSPFSSPAPTTSTSVNPFGLITSAVSTLFVVLAAFVVFFYLIAVLAVSLIARLFSRHVRQGAVLLLVFLAFFWSIIPFFVAAWIVVAIERAIRYYGVGAALLTKNRFNPAAVPYPLDPQVEQRVRSVFQPQDGNVVVYSGFSPFAGAGIRVGGWSFPVDVTRGKHEVGATLTPKAFTIDEIYTYVTNALKALDLEGKSELCGVVTFEDKLYVNGQEIRNDTRFLREPFARPYNQAHEQLLEQFMLNPTQDIRFYKCIRLTSWRGEMVLSIFYRFVMVANNLYVEVDYLLLPPLKEPYYQIDTIEPTLGLHKIWDIIKDSFISTTELWVRSPASMFRYVFSSSLHDRREKRARRSIQDNPAYDYGTRTSVREEASDDYRRYFQYLDKEMYVKIIERQLLESIVEFLEARNIDVSDFKKRQDMILNNGLIVSGGSVTAGNLAVGAQARATSSTSGASANP